MLPGLRHRRLARFPWLVFYVERDDHIDIWRVLDARRDIPTWLDDPDGHEPTREVGGCKRSGGCAGLRTRHATPR
jgi:hypothetical protein